MTLGLNLYLLKFPQTVQRLKLFLTVQNWAVDYNYDSSIYLAVQIF